MITQDEYIPSMVHVRIEINGIVAETTCEPEHAQEKEAELERIIRQEA